MKKNTKQKQKSKWYSFKHPLFTISIIISCILLLFFGTWIYGRVYTSKNEPYANSMNSAVTTSGTVRYVEEAGKTPYLIKEDNNGNPIDDFKILTISDTHFRETKEWDLALDVLGNYIDMEHPDLVIMLGDNLYKTTNTDIPTKVLQFFEDKQQYWTFVLGNHDSQGWEYDEGKEFWESRRLAFGYESGLIQYGAPTTHCLARSINPGEKLGYGTNLINIKGKDDKILESLFFFDCEAITKRNEDVINWYKDSLVTIKSENNGVMPKSIGFSHRPFKEMEWANNNRNNSDVKYNWGGKYETICYDGDYNGLLDEFVKGGSTDTMVCGHDHVNNLSISYKGINMIYTCGLQYNTYNSRNKYRDYYETVGFFLDKKINHKVDGATIFYIRKDQDLVIGNKYVEFNKQVFNGLEDKFNNKMGFKPFENLKWTEIFSRVLFPLVTAGVITYYGCFIAYRLKDKKLNNKKHK